VYDSYRGASNQLAVRTEERAPHLAEWFAEKLMR
jgi:hypothetical protein